MPTHASKHSSTVFFFPFLNYLILFLLVGWDGQLSARCAYIDTVSKAAFVLTYSRLLFSTVVSRTERAIFGGVYVGKKSGTARCF